MFDKMTIWRITMTDVFNVSKKRADPESTLEKVVMWASASIARRDRKKCKPFEKALQPELPYGK
jgi:hypothetical protein